jgi:hypothetical protein
LEEVGKFLLVGVSKQATQKRIAAIALSDGSLKRQNDRTGEILGKRIGIASRKTPREVIKR